MKFAPYPPFGGITWACDPILANDLEEKVFWGQKSQRKMFPPVKETCTLQNCSPNIFLGRHDTWRCTSDFTTLGTNLKVKVDTLKMSPQKRTENTWVLDDFILTPDCLLSKFMNLSFELL